MRGHLLFACLLIIASLGFPSLSQSHETPTRIEIPVSKVSLAHPFIVPRSEEMVDQDGHSGFSFRYRVVFPLKEAIEHVEAVEWPAPTLQDALFFVDLLQGGKVRGLELALTRTGLEEEPKHSESDMFPRYKIVRKSCQWCEIKRLIF